MARVIKAEAMKAQEAHRAKVLRLTDVAVEAERIVHEAQKRAAKILSETQHAVKSAAEAAEKRRKHNAQAESKFTAERRELLALAKKIVGELQTAQTELIRSNEQQMLHLSLSLAERVVGRVAPRDIAAAKANLRKVLELAGASGQVVVRVNPAQLHKLYRHCRELIDTLGRGQVQLIADEAISPGGAKLISGRGEIDATIETQLANVVAAVAGETHGAPGAQPGRYVRQAAPAEKSEAKHELA